MGRFFKNGKIYKFIDDIFIMEKRDDIIILKELFDEKIIKIIEVFIKHPEKKFYLSEVAALSGINISTTFRILKKLESQKFIKTTIIGKIRFYQLEKGEKVNALLKFLRKEKEDPFQEFLEKLVEYPSVKKVVLESKGAKEARILVVGDYYPLNRIERIKNEIEKKYGFKIKYVRISEEQFNGLKELGDYSLDKKIIWERKLQ